MTATRTTKTADADRPQPTRSGAAATQPLTSPPPSETRDGLAEDTLKSDHPAGTDGSGVVTSQVGLADILIAQAMRDEAIIAKMATAVQAGDKDAVFVLARELTCVTNDQK